MSDEEKRPSPVPSDDAPEEEPQSDAGLALDDVDVRDLLRTALSTPPPKGDAITEGVQRRIRERTQGRYYADGWSISTAPKATFLITSILMLVVLLLAWLLLTPRGLELLTL
ncbi:MAG: hypothetical protein RIF41_09565 [Polyangiaceae bacterium]